MPLPDSCPVKAVTRAGLCIGCGACATIAPGKLRFIDMADGRSEPVVAINLTRAERHRFRDICPGMTVGPAVGEHGAVHDRIWGAVADVRLAHAADPAVRNQAATGGVLTAVGSQLLDDGTVERVFHVGPSTLRPLSSEPAVSTTPHEVLARAGSRYTPSAMLQALVDVVGDGRRFAVIGKPCDINALVNLARTWPDLAQLMAVRLTMVCGGLNDIRLFEERLVEHGVNVPDVVVSRHRGFGCPGLVHHETRDGKVLEMTYTEFYGVDEEGWRLPLRCKVCPDAIGLQADLVALDSWPGGAPAGEGPGTNVVIIRTSAGRQAFDAAVLAGALIDGGPPPLPLGDYQPHHVARRIGAGPRLLAIALRNGVWPRIAGTGVGQAARAGGARTAWSNFAGAWRRAGVARRRDRPTRTW